MSRWNLPHRRKAFRAAPAGSTKVDWEDAGYATQFDFQFRANATGVDTSGDITRTSSSPINDSWSGDITSRLAWGWDYGALPSQEKIYYRHDTSGDRFGIFYGAVDQTADLEFGILAFVRQSNGITYLGTFDTNGSYSILETGSTLSSPNGIVYYITLDLVRNGSDIDATAKWYNTSDTLLSTITHSYASATYELSNNVGFYDSGTSSFIDDFEVFA